MKFSIIVPTRKRPVAVSELVETIVNTSDNFDLVEVLFYIDKDDFIEGVISADGYGSCLSSYDGNANEEYVQDQLFYVIRID
jgi:hypothetical protein